MLYNVDSLRIVEVSYFNDKAGSIVAVEGGVNIPFLIARVFSVQAPHGAVRGCHAHRECSQFLICASGAIEVICDDGVGSVKFMLDHPRLGLLLPPGIWSKQTYRGANASLIVLCDRRYEAGDYIRDYDLFQAFRDEAKRGREG